MTDAKTLVRIAKLLNIGHRGTELPDGHEHMFYIDDAHIAAVYVQRIGDENVPITWRKGMCDETEDLSKTFKGVMKANRIALTTVNRQILLHMLQNMDTDHVHLVTCDGGLFKVIGEAGDYKVQGIIAPIIDAEGD